MKVVPIPSQVFVRKVFYLNDLLSDIDCKLFLSKQINPKVFHSDGLARLEAMRNHFASGVRCSCIKYMELRGTYAPA